MGKRTASTRAGVPLSCILIISLGAGSTALAQTNRETTTPLPVGSVPATPTIPGIAGASDWLPGSPAAADSAAADSIAAFSATADSAAADSAAADSAGSASNRARRAGGTAGDTLREGAVISIEGARSAADRFLRLPPNTATGVSIGYPAYPGLFITAPADGPLAFRSGLTGFPTIGLLWTPGLEYRFGQESGTLSQNGVYAFSNAFLGRTYLDGDQHEYTGAEVGLGYRWFVDDRRGVRWIAAVEAGGYWRGDPVKPRRPCLRFLWTLVE